MNAIRTSRIGLALAALAVTGLQAITSPTASAVTDTGRATAIDAGDGHTCAITPAERLKCWGYGGEGQLGLGDAVTSNQSLPVLVPGLDNVKKVFTGTYNTCAVVGRSHQLQCWGRGVYGVVGDGTTDQHGAPVVTIASGVRTMDFGEYHACAVLDTGRVKCWGTDNFGETGTGVAGGVHLSPVLVKGLRNATSVSAGYRFTCATTSRGAAKCWGYNGSATLGDGTFTDRLSPTTVSGLSKGVTTVAAGYAHACAVVRDAVKCWGDNVDGVLGTGATRLFHPTPTAVIGMSGNITSLDVYYYYSCAVKGDTAKCWGNNQYGMLGTGDNLTRTAATTVKKLRSGAVEVQTGYWHACALKSDGTVLCWGLNDVGQVGIGTTGTAELVPQVAQL